MNIKICGTCKQPKALDDFYFHHSSGKHEKHCKVCKGERQKAYKKRKSSKSGVPHEQHLIDLLKRKGIHAVSGKRSRARWVDIVVFGCVAIEAKKGNRKNNSYHFSFTPKQVQQGIRGDILIFMIEKPDATLDYFLIRSDDPHLFHGDGTRKQWINYTPGSTHKNTDVEFVEFMDASRNQWGLILMVLNEKIRAMKKGTYEEIFTDQLPPVTYEKRGAYGKRRATDDKQAS